MSVEGERAPWSWRGARRPETSGGGPRSRIRELARLGEWIALARGAERLARRDGRRERTVQQADPLCGIGAWKATSGVLAIGSLIALVRVFAIVTENGPTALALLSAVAYVAGAAVLLVASTPERAPVRSASMTAVFVCVFCFFLGTALAGSPTAPLPGDEWAAVAVAMAALAFAPYRPPAEIVSAGCVLAIAVGAAAFLQPSTNPDPAAPVLRVLVSVAPVVAATAAAAVMAMVLLDATRRWAASVAAEASDGRHEERHPHDDDRAEVLRSDVGPFFGDLLERDRVGQAERTRAAAISESIRRIMVQDADRSPLGTLLAHVAAEAGVPVDASAAHDPEGLGAGMSLDQRAALRAALHGVLALPGLDPTSVRVELAAREGRVHGVVRAHVAYDAAQVRGDLLPYLVVLRILFSQAVCSVSPVARPVGPGANASVEESRVRLGFDYDR